jgi:HAD superfamily hydrolase (TIGR01509 family)
LTLRGAVFDLDGTMVDNMRWHARAWIAMVRAHTADPRSDEEIEQFLYAHAGMKNSELVPLLVPVGDVAALEEEKESLYRKLYAPSLAPVPGLLPLLDSLHERGVKLAVASAAPQANRDLVLDGLALRSRFDAIVGPEHARRGKPAPDIFLAAAKLLGVAPSDCIAFEDAPKGVEAAVAAGMRCAALTTTSLESDLRAAGARWIAQDFTQLSAIVEKL